MCRLQLHSTESSIGQEKNDAFPWLLMLPSAEPGGVGDSWVSVWRTSVMEGGFFTISCGQSKQT